MKLWLLLILAVIIGLIIGWVDSRPTWDDAGVTAGMVILAAAMFGAVNPSRAWIWAIAVGGSVFLLNVILHKNYGASDSSGCSVYRIVCGCWNSKSIRIFRYKQRKRINCSLCNPFCVIDRTSNHRYA